MFEKDKFDGMREEIDEIAKANGLELPEFTFTPGLGSHFRAYPKQNAAEELPRHSKR